MDALTLKRIELLHPKLRKEALAIYTEIVGRLTGRAICRFSYTLRTFAEQEALYAQGRTKFYDAGGNRVGIVTNAGPGRSYHNYGLAVDIALLKDTDGNGTFETASWEHTKDFDGDGVADWMEAVQVFQKYGWAWGGNFKSLKDYPHFEKAFGFSTSALLERKKAGKVDEAGYIIF